VKQWEMALFIMGEKMKILKSNFWPEKYINMGPQYTKRCRIATFGGIFQYFHEKIMIYDF
jgi:hypothetical protein